MTPYIVLGTYKFKKGRKCFEMGRFLTRITRDMGFIPFKNDEIKRNPKAAWSNYELHAEVRKTFAEDSEATDWHMDGDTSTDNMDCAIITWCNRNPTEFKVGNEIFQPQPYELVISRNLGSLHRRPQVDGKRYFFRQRVQIPNHIKLP